MMRVELVNQSENPYDSLGGMGDLPQGATTAFGDPLPEIDEETIASWGKVGRNQACPCGSGLKYKHCHGQFV